MILINTLTLKKIKDELESQGKSYQWLADQLRVSKALVGHLLSGERKMKTERLSSIANALNVDVIDLLPNESIHRSGPLHIQLRGELSTRKSKRALEVALFAIEDYVTMKGANE